MEVKLKAPHILTLFYILFKQSWQAWQAAAQPGSAFMYTKGEKHMPFFSFFSGFFLRRNSVDKVVSKEGSL